MSHVSPQDLYRWCKVRAEDLSGHPARRVPFRLVRDSREMGLLKIPDGLLAGPQHLKKLPRERVAVALPGSQAEPLAALSRVAVKSHRWLTLEPGDDVVISARIIPGNEKSIFRMIDHLYRRGARVH